MRKRLFAVMNTAVELSSRVNRFAKGVPEIRAPIFLCGDGYGAGVVVPHNDAMVKSSSGYADQN